MTPEWFTWESAGFIRSFHFPALSRLLNRLYSSHSPGLLIWNIYSSEMMGQQIQYTHILFYHNFPGLYCNRKEFLWVLDTYLISWKRASVRGLIKFWAIFLNQHIAWKIIEFWRITKAREWFGDWGTDIGQEGKVFFSKCRIPKDTSDLSLCEISVAV